jgi:predicted nucleic acid-binding protein
VAERAAVNASPLIFLAAARLLDFLTIEAPQIVVPEMVWNEVGAQDDGALNALAALPWLRVVKPENVFPRRVVEWDLGDGESSVLAFALAHPGTSVVIDDLAARRCATALGLELTGTLGLVLRARQRGTISSAREVLLRLRSAGMYLSDAVLGRALAKVGERL